MASRMLRVDTVTPAADVIEAAVRSLSEGELVVAPTETRYGLLARADRQDVLEELYRVKQRPLTNPTALFVRGRSDLGSYGRVTPAAESLAARYLPGPLTLVLESRHDWSPPRVVDGRIGLRYSSASLIAALVGAVSFPLTATSANRAGMPDFIGVDPIQACFGDAVALYLDGGSLSAAPSTVVACLPSGVSIVREGSISRTEIARALEEADGR